MRNLTTTRGAADALRVSRATLDRLRRKDPSFPRPLRYGARCHRWDVAELETWAESKRAPVAEAATPEAGTVRGA